MFRRYEVSDKELVSLQGRLAQEQTPSRSYLSHRTNLNGTLCCLHAEVLWQDLPPRNGPW
jgi:hypothetical protein